MMRRLAVRSFHVATAAALLRAGVALAALIAEGYARAGLEPRDGDVLALAQKIVSKVEGRAVRLSEVEPSPEAIELAAVVRKCTTPNCSSRR